MDKRGVIGGAGADAPDALWRQAHNRALAALEIPGIVVVLGPADVSGTFLQSLMAGLLERGRTVTFVPRVDVPRLWPDGCTLVIEDAAQMDAALLEAICRPPGRRIVLAGVSTSVLAELPAPLTPALLTVVTLEPLSPETADALTSSKSNARVAIESCLLASALAKLPAPLTPAPLTVVPIEPLSPETASAPRSFSKNNARLAIASGLLAATCVAGALLWTRAPWVPPAAPATGHVAALQPAVELPLAPASPPAAAASASDQSGDATSAAAPVPMPAGDEDRLNIGTSFERPADPVVAQTEPRSASEPAPPQLQAGPSPVPDGREALNLPPAAPDANQLASPLPPLAEAWATPPEPTAPGRVGALHPTIEQPPAFGSPTAPPEPPEPAPPAAAIAPTPAPSASKQPGDTTSSAAPAPRPAGDQDRPGIGTSFERPAVTVEPRSANEPAPPQLQVGPSPVPDGREALNLPPAAPDANQLVSPLLPLAEAPRATPPEPAAPGRVGALHPRIELPPISGSATAPPEPPEPAPPAAAIAPMPTPSASKQPGDATSAAAPAPRPAGDQDRPGTSRGLPAVLVAVQTEPRSGGEPAPPQLQAGPSPVPDSRLALNVPAAAIATLPLAEAPRAMPPEPAAPSGSARQLLPENAPIRVLVSYAPHTAAARKEAAELVRLLRGGGLAASDPAPAAGVAGKAGIIYFFAEDLDGARRVEHDLGEVFGHSRLSPPSPGAPLPRPGTIEVLVSAR